MVKRQEQSCCEERPKKKKAWLSKDVARTQQSLKVHGDPGGEIDHAFSLAWQRLISGEEKRSYLTGKMLQYITVSGMVHVSYITVCWVAFSRRHATVDHVVC